ncbi:MAG: (2Fe-2S) ferredoxin domain-containing protein [Nitrososphaerota archaeon]
MAKHAKHEKHDEQHDKHEQQTPGAAEKPRPAADIGDTADTTELTDAIWEKHVFVCTSGKYCAEIDGNGLGVHMALKRQVAVAGLKGRVRINQSGCVDQCGYGPIVVVYPETVWYAGVQPEDVEEIVREHLVGGKPVERLRYRNRPGKNKLPRDDRNQPIGRPARR